MKERSIPNGFLLGMDPSLMGSEWAPARDGSNPNGPPLGMDQSLKDLAMDPSLIDSD